MKIKYDFVEDYIEVLAGYRSLYPKAQLVPTATICVSSTPIVNLPPNDAKIVVSLADQSNRGNGYTDRQAKLAYDLILRYEHQLSQYNIDVDSIRIPKYRLPFRNIDRTNRVWVEDGIIKLRFPYNESLVDQVRAAAKESKGSIKFNRDTRIQELSLTEWNLNWVYVFATTNNFTIDSSVQVLMDQIIVIEQTPYAIELIYADNKLSITNARDSLIEYINEHGGFGPENLLRLIDLAPILGYTVSDDIRNSVESELGDRFWKLCSNNQFKVSGHIGEVSADIANYAKTVDRFPIFIYEPDLSDRLLKDFELLFPNQVTHLGNKLASQIVSDTKIIYTQKIPRESFDRIPLMISSAGMIYGGDKQCWLQNAEKIIYFANDVFNKSSKGPNICDLT